MPARYDRSAASNVLARLAFPSPFDTDPVPADVRIEYTATALAPEPGSHLTLSQRLYLDRFMHPCPATMVTSASHRIVWTDSDGIPNTGHFGPGDLGPIVPIAARETTLALWRALADNHQLAGRIAALGEDERAVLVATTTDHDPIDIFRVGIEATGRALVQHALVADPTTPAEFARTMRDSGLFSAVATRWFWELQASTYRRGMIPVSLARQANGTIRYTAETVAMLRAMKEATIADAHEVMRRATTEEGLTIEQSVAKYHQELDLISRQYALLDPDTQPRCLAAMPHDLDGQRHSILPGVVHSYVETFVAALDRCEIVEKAADPGTDELLTDVADRQFFVPDMNCKHCTVTIRAVLETMGITVFEVDLGSKRVLAEFRSTRNKTRAFEAIRDSGYNPVEHQ